MNSIVGISIINIMTNKIKEFFGLLRIVSILIAIVFQFTHKKKNFPRFKYNLHATTLKRFINCFDV